MDEKEHEKKAEDQEKGRNRVRKTVREPAPHTYIFQCVQKTSVPKCNIN